MKKKEWEFIITVKVLSKRDITETDAAATILHMEQIYNNLGPDRVHLLKTRIVGSESVRKRVEAQLGMK